MKELMQAIKEKWGEDAGLVIYADLSGHIFKGESYEDIVDNSLLSFDDVTLLTLDDLDKIE